MPPQTPSVVLWRRRIALLLEGPGMTCWEVRHFNHFDVFGIFIWSSVIESKKTGILSWGKCSLVKSFSMLAEKGRKCFMLIEKYAAMMDMHLSSY